MIFHLLLENHGFEIKLISIALNIDLGKLTGFIFILSKIENLKPLFS